MHIVVAPAMRTSKFIWFVLTLMPSLALLATGFTTPVKASSGSKISICATSSVSSIAGFCFNVSGILMDDKGNAISGELVFLHYQWLGDVTWYEFASVQSKINGYYSAVWIPTATGYYLVRATWANDSIVPRTSAVVSLAVIPFREQNVFAVESNSTISALVFNSTEYELSFDASSPSGTTGYAKIFISKELVADISDLKVRVDATQIDFVTASTDASWVLHFSYVHSTHHVVIAIPAPTDGGLGYNGNLIYAIIVIVAILIVIAIYFLKRKPEVKS